MRAHDRLDPWGPERMDYGFARLMALYFNAHRKEGAPAKMAADFMPDWLTDPKAAKRLPTPEEQNAALMQMAQSLGAAARLERSPVAGRWAKRAEASRRPQAGLRSTAMQHNMPKSAALIGTAQIICRCPPATPSGHRRPCQ